jgi:outer membrane lipoprotein-sorting protein
MMKRFALLLVGVSVSAGLTGCFSTTRLVQRTQAPDMYRSASVEQIEKSVSDRDAAIETLNASVLITATTGGGRTGKVTEYTSFKGYIFVRKPTDLRVILQLPVFGSRALDMVSNGSGFTLMHASSHGDVWMQGSNVVKTPSKNALENLRPPVFLDSLLVAGVRDDELVTMPESTRIIAPTDKHKPAIEEPDYDLIVMKKKSGNILQLERVVHISRVTMLPYQQDIYDDDGRIVTQATYDKYQEVSGVQFPMLINISRPLDQYSLKIEVTKLALNGKLEDDQFQLVPPVGVVVQKME